MAGRLGEIPDETKELVELQRYHPTLHIATKAVPKIVPNQNQNVRRALLSLFQLTAVACGEAIRAHNLCHNDRQLITIAINYNHSASKNNCN